MGGGGRGGGREEVQQRRWKRGCGGEEAEERRWRRRAMLDERRRFRRIEEELAGVRWIWEDLTVARISEDSGGVRRI